MRWIALASAVAAGLVAGCVAEPTPYTMRTVLNEADFVPYTNAGPVGFTGQAFMRQRGGNVVTCAGSPVALFPATPYTREMLDAVKGGGSPNIPTGTGRLQGALRQTTCDAQGRFSFNGLPGGLPWIVATEVKWYAGRYQQGGALIREITPTDGSEIILSEADYAGR